MKKNTANLVMVKTESEDTKSSFIDYEIRKQS